MKISPVAFAVSFLTVGALLAGCSGAPAPKDDTLKIALSIDIDSWNPQESLLVSSAQVSSQVLAGLVKTSPDGAKILPSLASSYELDPAATTLTFHLDPQAAFSDGTPVTAADVVFSEHLWSSSELYGATFTSIESVAAPDDHTVVFTLNGPDHALLGNLSTTTAAVVPKDYGGKAEKDFWLKPIGAGPYAIESQKKGESIDLVRNSKFIGGSDSLPAKLNYRIVADPAQQLLQFQSGAVDIVNGVPVDSASQYDPAVLTSTASSGVSLLVTHSTVAPFNEPAFGQAMSLAIDHKALVEGGYAGNATQATSLLPQIVPGVAACTSCDWGTHDVAKAKSLLSKTSYKGAPLTLLVASDAGPDLLAAQAIVPMLAEAGINVTVESLAGSAIIDRLGKGDFDLAAVNYNATAPTPSDPLSFLIATGIVFSGADTTAATTAHQAVAAAADEPAIKAATATFESWAYTNAAVVPLAVPKVIYAVSNRVQGFIPNPYSVYSVAPLSLKG